MAISCSLNDTSLDPCDKRLIGFESGIRSPFGHPIPHFSLALLGAS